MFDVVDDADRTISRKPSAEMARPDHVTVQHHEVHRARRDFEEAGVADARHLGNVAKATCRVFGAGEFPDQAEEVMDRIHAIVGREP
ncbi:hypothetical protein AJ87_26970 [Rhizobium yanglingense]|nr:hypothetical protein AJ87_26970 [Rhizobium yanglingense]